MCVCCFWGALSERRRRQRRLCRRGRWAKTIGKSSALGSFAQYMSRPATRGCVVDSSGQTPNGPRVRKVGPSV